MFLFWGSFYRELFESSDSENSEPLLEQGVHLFVGSLQGCRDVRALEKDRVKISSQDSNGIACVLADRKEGVI
jgi:hypothetical protein